MKITATNKQKVKLPIEIINKILFYVGELNNEILIRQYCIISKNEYYKINLFSDYLWNLKCLLVVKRLYPLYNSVYDNSPSIMKHIELYRWAKAHYEITLRKTIK